MKQILFIGFFGMQQKHAGIYINMWKNLGANVDNEVYRINDTFNIYKHHKIRNKFIPKKQHYDIIYCISGGSLHMLNLLQAKNKFTYNKIIFDSGPYLYDTCQAENYLKQMYPTTLKYIPIEKILNVYYGEKIKVVNKEYESVVLNLNVPKLILTSKTDTMIDQIYIKNYIKSSTNIKHIEFEKGSHANIYKTNKDEYTAIMFEALNNI